MPSVEIIDDGDPVAQTAQTAPVPAGATGELRRMDFSSLFANGLTTDGVKKTVPIRLGFIG